MPGRVAALFLCVFNNRSSILYYFVRIRVSCSKASNTAPVVVFIILKIIELEFIFTESDTACTMSIECLFVIAAVNKYASVTVSSQNS